LLLAVHGKLDFRDGRETVRTLATELPSPFDVHVSRGMLLEGDGTLTDYQDLDITDTKVQPRYHKALFDLVNNDPSAQVLYVANARGTPEGLKVYKKAGDRLLSAFPGTVGLNQVGDDGRISQLVLTGPTAGAAGLGSGARPGSRLYVFPFNRTPATTHEWDLLIAQRPHTAIYVLDDGRKVGKVDVTEKFVGHLQEEG